MKLRLSPTVRRAVVAAGLMVPIFVSSEYCDLPGFSGKLQQGRTINSLASIISGIVSKEAYGSSSSKGYVGKFLWPDAELNTEVDSNSISSLVGVLFTSSKLEAKYPSNFLEGSVEKSEFDWKVKQIGVDTYEINRFGPKFDTTLDISVRNGVIHGMYKRPFGFDWAIEGAYDDQGYSFNVSVPLGLDFSVNAKKSN